MDSNGFIDRIQVEKANALSRYRRFNNISNILTLIEVFIAVIVISWSSTRLPTVFKVSGEYLYAYSSYLLNQHVVFLVGNAIVVTCYVLSGHTDAGNLTAGPEIAEDNRYRCRSTESARSADDYKVTESVEPVIPPPVKLPEMKQTVTEINRDKVVRSEKTYLKTEPEVTAETAIKQAAKQIERFQRTQSVKLRGEMTMKPRGELRRSATERRRSAVTGGDDCSSPSSFESVERLSNEEFRLAVEAFISKQQRILKQQTMVEESYYL